MRISSKNAFIISTTLILGTSIISSLIHFFIDDNSKPFSVHHIQFIYPAYFISCAIDHGPGHTLATLFMVPGFAFYMLCAFARFSAIKHNFPSHQIKLSNTLSLALNIFTALGGIGVVAVPASKHLMIHLLFASLAFVPGTAFVLVDHLRLTPILRKEKSKTNFDKYAAFLVVACFLGMALSHIYLFDLIYAKILGLPPLNLSNITKNAILLVTAVCENLWLWSMIAYFGTIINSQPFEVSLQEGSHKKVE